jgi:hypothetical protein
MTPLELEVLRHRLEPAVKKAIRDSLQSFLALPWIQVECPRVRELLAAAWTHGFASGGDFEIGQEVGK